MSETSPLPLEGRIALITGASRGIGYYSALGYAKAGAHVIALARTVGGLEELDDEIIAAGGSATLVPLDLKDFEAIDRLGATIYERWGKLDVLFANAGMLGTITPVSHMPPAMFEDIFAVNVTANWRLIRSMDPLLQAAEAGRAIFMSSGAAQNCRAFTGAYSSSKAALEALVKTYANENQKTSVCANLVDPGTLRTKMRAQYSPGEDPATVRHPEEIVPTILNLSVADELNNGGIYDFPTECWKT